MKLDNFLNEFQTASQEWDALLAKIPYEHYRDHMPDLLRMLESGSES